MSAPYRPPLRDIAFALEHVADAGSLTASPAFAHADIETVSALLGEFGRFCSEVLAPIDQPGDVAGVGFDPKTGEVTTAPGWKDAYDKFVAAGWGSVSFAQEFGGGGFPWLLSIAMQEMLNAASVAFSLAPMLTQGAVHMLSQHGSAAQQARYLPDLVSGTWAGTMNLTEPQAGSDVGALLTRAEPAADGTWRLTGRKIFITYGEQDLTEQIVHLVLARVVGAPGGTRGISCFIVPKRLVRPDGSLGEQNAVRCIGVEHKMGLHASPTCILEYDGAVGELIGEANAGMHYMFTMMNYARLSVGMEGLGVATRAYQAAADFARERVQGTVVGGAPGDPIIGHPDIRRMLVHMRSHIEAMRGLAFVNARAIDDGDQELFDLLTPIVKSWCTDVGGEVARLAVQVFGGMGYIRESGVERHERDVRVTSIYEGSNGIQAIDLVGRKLGMRDGAAMAELLARVEATAGDLDGDLAPARARLVEGVVAARQATDWLSKAAGRDRRDVLAGATPYLRLLATVLGGWVMARQALAARPGAADDPFLAAKVTTARYYLEQVLPPAVGLVAAITAGADDLDAIPAALL